VDEVRRVVKYLRVSTDEQKKKQTVGNQAEALKRYEAARPDAMVVDEFVDEGVSGTVAFGERAQGRRLLVAARAGKFDEVWVVRADRLGRDAADMLVLWRTFKELEVKPVGTEQSIESYLSYGIQALFADDEHETIRSRLLAGTERWAAEGCYVGGMAPLGYMVALGEDKRSRLVPNDTIVWSNLTEADVARRIFNHLAIDRWSCRRIAIEFNRLGISTSSDPRSRRGRRASNIQPIWRPGHVRNIVVNPVYRGVYQFGRRSNKADRPVIMGPCHRLVSDEIWYAAQETLAENRIIPKNSTYVALLRSVIKCAECGLTFCTARGRGDIRWYRCNGYMVERAGKDYRCIAKSIKNSDIEPPVWSDIERFLRNPGDVLDELAADVVEPPAAAIEADRITIETALADLEDRRRRKLSQHERGHINDEELDGALLTLAGDKAEIERRLAALTPTEDLPDVLDADLLEALRERLESGLTAEQRQEIAKLLIRQITVHTFVSENGKKQARVEVQYRFSSPGVVPTRNGTRASQNYTNLKRVVYV
jgi:site-specific DNA recombinase